VFTELHAENLKNEEDVDTGLLGMNFLLNSSSDSFLFLKVMFKFIQTWNKLFYISMCS
jgi:hypothetical protein